MTELKQSALPEYAPRAPELIPVAFINIKVNEPQGILTNSNYKQGINLVNVINGEVTSVPNKFGYELDVQNVVGYDHITGNTEAGINKLDCNLYGRTPNGSGVFIKYVGTIKVTESVGNTLSGKAKATDFEEEYVTNNPTFLFADTVEDKYKWALKENFIGKGRFVRDDEHKLYVQYYLYVLH